MTRALLVAIGVVTAGCQLVLGIEDTTAAPDGGSVDAPDAPDAPGVPDAPDGPDAPPVHAPGSLDETFGSDESQPGVASLALAGPEAAALALAVLPDGRILVAGHGGWVIRLLPDGTQDSTFSPSGGAIQLAESYIQRLAVTEGGSFYTAGFAGTSLVVRRFLESGMEDGTFAGFGMESVGGVDLAIDGQGGCLIAATIAAAAHVYRLPDALDGLPAFTASQELGPITAIAVVARDSSFLLGGSGSFGQDSFQGVASRHRPDGSPMLTWGVAGLLSLDLGASFVLDVATVIEGEDDSGDRFVVAGGHAGRAIAASAPAGNASVVLATDDRCEEVGRFEAVAAQGDGRTVLAGTCDSSGFGRGRGLVRRLDAQGAFDPSFEAPWVGDGTVTLNAIAVQPDGKIVVAGGRSGTGYLVARFWP